MARQINEGDYFRCLLADLYPIEIAVLGTIDDISSRVKALNR